MPTKSSDEDVEDKRNELKRIFDDGYPFPQESYRYVFYFLEIIHSLGSNNAVFPFESVSDIQDLLRRQWAGFVFDALTRDKTVPSEALLELSEGVERIEAQLRLLAEGRQEDDTGDRRRVAIDLSRLTARFDLDDLERTQAKIAELLGDILRDYRGAGRITFRERWELEHVDRWMSRLPELTKAYKWSDTVPVTEVFKQVQYTWYKNRADVPYRALLELQAIVEAMSPEDQTIFRNTLRARFNELFEQETDDDLPF